MDQSNQSDASKVLCKPIRILYQNPTKISVVAVHEISQCSHLAIIIIN